MREFENKVALVTGGGNGIGLAAAMLFAERGARVAVVDVDRKAGEKAVDDLREKGHEAIFICGDVTDKEHARDMVAQTVRMFGGLDCAFNNAGITHMGDADWDDDAFQRTVDVNLTALMRCMKAELAYMVPNRHGSIVNTSSVAGLVASAKPSLPAYTATKHAIIGLTKVAALRHAKDGVRVNAILPGITDTRMVHGVAGFGEDERRYLENFSPMGRIAAPAEVAEAAIWLCSDRASYVTAHSLVVDGGFLAQ